MKRKWTVSGSDFHLVQCYSPHSELHLSDFIYFTSVGANLSLQNPYLYACVENGFNLRCSTKPNRDKNELILLLLLGRVSTRGRAKDQAQAC